MLTFNLFERQTSKINLGNHVKVLIEHDAELTGHIILPRKYLKCSNKCLISFKSFYIRSAQLNLDNRLVFRKCDVFLVPCSSKPNWFHQVGFWSPWIHHQSLQSSVAWLFSQAGSIHSYSIQYSPNFTLQPAGCKLFQALTLKVGLSLGFSLKEILIQRRKCAFSFQSCVTRPSSLASWRRAPRHI